MSKSIPNNPIASSPRRPRLTPPFFREGMGVGFVPHSITNTAIITYFAAIFGCTLLYSGHILNWKWWIFGIVSAVGFFYYANIQSKAWMRMRPMSFAKKLFWSAFALRVVWVLVSYLLYYNWTDRKSVV